MPTRKKTPRPPGARLGAIDRKPRDAASVDIPASRDFLDTMRRDKGSEKPPRVVFDNGIISEQPAYTKRGVLFVTESEQRTVAGILYKDAQRWPSDAPFINAERQQEILDLSLQIMSLKNLVFTGDVQETNRWDLSFADDPADVGHIIATLEHPPLSGGGGGRQFRPGYNCNLEASDDGGLTWYGFWDPLYCVLYETHITIGAPFNIQIQRKTDNPVGYDVNVTFPEIRDGAPGPGIDTVSVVMLPYNSPAQAQIIQNGNLRELHLEVPQGQRGPSGETVVADGITFTGVGLNIQLWYDDPGVVIEDGSKGTGWPVGTLVFNIPGPRNIDYARVTMLPAGSPATVNLTVEGTAQTGLVTYLNLALPLPADGATGPRGLGIDAATAQSVPAGDPANATIIENTTNGTRTLSIQVPRGEPGEPGLPGGDGANGRDGKNGILIDDVPPTNTEIKEYTLLVMGAGGAALPFPFAVGQQISGVTTKGLWGLSDSGIFRDPTVVAPGQGLTNENGETHGNLTISYRPVDNPLGLGWHTEPATALQPTYPVPMHVWFNMDFPSNGWFGLGYIIATFTVSGSTPFRLHMTVSNAVIGVGGGPETEVTPDVIIPGRKWRCIIQPSQPGEVDTIHLYWGFGSVRSAADNLTVKISNVSGIGYPDYFQLFYFNGTTQVQEDRPISNGVINGVYNELYVSAKDGLSFDIEVY